MEHKDVTPQNKYMVCPYCVGKGVVAVPAINDGKIGMTARDCRKCKGTGKLVVVADNERIRHLVKK